MDNIDKQQYESACLLLPWYITSKLTQTEKEEVEDALDISPELQLELKEQQQLAQMVQEDPDVLDLVTISSQEKRFDSLMERINQVPHEPKTPFWKQLMLSFSEGLDAFRSSVASHQLQAAFSLFIVAQIAIIAVVMNKQDDPAIYKPAGEVGQSQDVPIGKKVLVFQFTSQAGEVFIESLFQKIGAQVVGYSEGSDNYKVFLTGTVSEQEVDRLISDLQKKTEILLIGRGSIK